MRREPQPRGSPTPQPPSGFPGGSRGARLSCPAAAAPLLLRLQSGSTPQLAPARLHLPGHEAQRLGMAARLLVVKPEVAGFRVRLRRTTLNSHHELKELDVYAAASLNMDLP